MVNNYSLKIKQKIINTILPNDGDTFLLLKIPVETIKQYLDKIKEYKQTSCLYSKNKIYNYLENNEDDIRFYLVSPCNANLKLTKEEVSSFVPVCYAYAQTLKTIAQEYKKHNKNLEDFIKEVCYEGNINEDILPLELDNIASICSCIPNIKNINEERTYEYNKQICSLYLQNPKILLKVKNMITIDCDNILPLFTCPFIFFN